MYSWGSLRPYAIGCKGGRSEKGANKSGGSGEEDVAGKDGWSGGRLLLANAAHAVEPDPGASDGKMKGGMFR